MSPHLRGGDPLRQAPDDGAGDPDHWERHFVDREEFDGFHIVGPEELTGYDRYPWVVENAEEITLEYGRQGDRPEIHCAYCHQRHRSRDVRRAVHWFNTHDCHTFYIAEQRGLIQDLLDFAAAA